MLRRHTTRRNVTRLKTLPSEDHINVKKRPPNPPESKIKKRAETKLKCPHIISDSINNVGPHEKCSRRRFSRPKVNAAPNLAESFKNTRRASYLGCVFRKKNFSKKRTRDLFAGGIISRGHKSKSSRNPLSFGENSF